MFLSMSSVHNVSTKETKDVRINVKTKPSLRLEFRAVSIIKEESMSNLVNRFMRQSVNEMKAIDIEKFQEALGIAKAEEEKESKRRGPGDFELERLPPNTGLITDDRAKTVRLPVTSPANQIYRKDAKRTGEK